MSQGKAEPESDIRAAHSALWSCDAAATSAAVQFVLRHWAAVDWKVSEVHAQVRLVLTRVSEGMRVDSETY